MDGVETIYDEIDNIPSTTDTLLILHDPQLQNDKDVPFLKHESRRVIIPVNRILYIEVLDDEEKVPTIWKED